MELNNIKYVGWDVHFYTFQVFKDYALIFEYEEKISDVEKFKEGLLKLKN